MVPRRLALVLFAIYSVLYLLFVLVNSFWPKAMERPVVAGLNLAVFYGLGLIFLAFGLALFYGIWGGDSVEQKQLRDR